MSEGNLLRAKKAHTMAVTAKLREAKPPADVVPKIIPAARQFQSESGFPVANPENHPYYHIANSVVDYLAKQRSTSPEDWPHVIAHQYKPTHRLIQKDGSPHNVAFKAAIRQLKQNPGLEKKPKELEARLRLVLENRRKKP